MDLDLLPDDEYGLVLDQFSYMELLNMRSISKRQMARIDTYLRGIAARLRNILGAAADHISDGVLTGAAYHLTHPMGTPGAPTTEQLLAVIVDTKQGVRLSFPSERSEVRIIAHDFTCYYRDVPHRIGRPAVIYRPEGGGGHDEWYHRARIFRAGGPAVIAYYNNGVIKEEVWREDWSVDDRIRLDGGPSLINYNMDGTVRRERWYKGLVESRENLPARIDYIRRLFMFEGQIYDINIIIKQWKVEGLLHRVDGPAITVETAEGKVFYQAWVRQGLYYRLQQIDLGLDGLTIPFDVEMDKPDAYGPDVPKSHIYRDFL